MSDPTLSILYSLARIVLPRHSPNGSGYRDYHNHSSASSLAKRIDSALSGRVHCNTMIESVNDGDAIAVVVRLAPGADLDAAARIIIRCHATGLTAGLST